jgi:hydrogenase maturation protease
MGLPAALARAETSEAVPQEMREPRVLLIAYGNCSRRDDGVAFEVLDRLASRLAVGEQDPEFEDVDALAGRPAVLRLHQLTPDLAKTVARFDVVIFIDAHEDASGWKPVDWRAIEPAYGTGIVGHHLGPGVVMALCHTLYGAAPRGITLSVLGHDFAFGEALSPATSQLADDAVQQLQELLVSDLGLLAPSGSQVRVVIH